MQMMGCSSCVQTSILISDSQRSNLQAQADVGKCKVNPNPCFMSPLGNIFDSATANWRIMTEETRATFSPLIQTPMLTEQTDAH